jgi:hypothetical protein
MEREASYSFEDIYNNIDCETHHITKENTNKLLEQPSSTDTFFCSDFCNCLSYCCFFF